MARINDCIMSLSMCEKLIAPSTPNTGPREHLVTHHVLGDFAKADHVWLDPLLDELALNAAMLVRGEGSQLMNKLALATGGKPEPEAAKKPAAQSRIRAARNHAQPKILPASGPMAEMLKKLLGGKDE